MSGFGGLRSCMHLTTLCTGEAAAYLDWLIVQLELVELALAKLRQETDIEGALQRREPERIFHRSRAHHHSQRPAGWETQLGVHQALPSVRLSRLI
jgi:hypothetical protein